MTITPGKFLVRASCLALSLAWLTGCSHHPPAPVEDRSTTRQASQLDADGRYRIKPGDTLYAIAFNYGLDPQDLAGWNGISSPYVIYPDQRLRLSPPPVSHREREREKSADVQISAVRTPAEVTRAAPSQPGAGAQSGTVRKKPPVARPAATPVKVAATDPGQWLWPTEGRLLRGYVAGDPARNGLDIAGDEGQAIRASAAGAVVYSGNGLIAYGELIIIKHSERMLSAYAHNKVRLVQEGEQVSAGQKIAEMGRNDSNQALLHFEIRVRGKPVDPLNHLPKK